MERSTEIDKIAAALAKAQANIKFAIKDSTNPHYRSKYSNLTSILEACRPALTENGLAVIQAPYTGTGNEVGLETMLLHESGQFFSQRFSMPVPKFDPQGIGSAITYSRRYTLAAMVGVTPDDDDDAESAMLRPTPIDHTKAVRERIETKTAPVAKKLAEESLLEACDNLETLMDVWSRFSPDKKAILLGLKNRIKEKLSEKAPNGAG
jgi:hypothetical protein